MNGKQRSAATYHGHIKGQHADKQNALVVMIMLKLNQPTTIRMMQKALNGRGYVIDLVSLRRAVTNLSHAHPKNGWINTYGKAVLHVVYEQPCPITNKRVGWYQIIPGVLQLDLFKNKYPNPTNHGQHLLQQQ